MPYSTTWTPMGYPVCWDATPSGGACRNGMQYWRFCLRNQLLGLAKASWRMPVMPTAAFEICPTPAQSPGKFEHVWTHHIASCWTLHFEKSTTTLLPTSSPVSPVSPVSKALGSFFVVHWCLTTIPSHRFPQEIIHGRPTAPPNWRIEPEQIVLSEVHRFSSPKCRNVQKCVRVQPTTTNPTLAEDTLELRFKVFLESTGSRHRKQMQHSLLRVEVNKLLFKLMQLFCANDLTIQQVQRNLQIIHMCLWCLVFFSWFSLDVPIFSNRLFHLITGKNVQGQDQRVQRSSKIHLRDLVHGTSSNHLADPVVFEKRRHFLCQFMC